MRHKDAVATGEAAVADGDRLRAVLDGLRSIADVSDPDWRPRLFDARAIVDGAWAALADALDDKPQAGAVLELLRRLTIADDTLMRSAGAPRRPGASGKRWDSSRLHRRRWRS
ncbi:hypothetical protein [Mycolicibacterium pyrenivorans]|uniref:hypothetical protein n=1 Tax=Mycolicibacterium pyrenivorans TaxID=187102 RepID=UPI0021F27893|nr:hypothetical protein [Mycolicibacterium pyrenivorans]MCV7154884.1 hypothetical protein [Mycolicibacterium pyrenivorans]